jgi:hypothetical protein
MPYQPVASGSTHSHFPVQHQNQGYTQPATSGSSNMHSNGHFQEGVLEVRHLNNMTEEERDAYFAECEYYINML